jgi:hypothetical protein
VKATGDLTRPARVHALTPAGWLTGDLRVPTGSALLEHLNRARGLLRLANVLVEGHGDLLPFAAVQRPALRLVVPMDEADALAPRSPGEPHDVAGVLDVAAFQGQVRLAGTQRVSDFIASAPPFVAVTDCRLWTTRGPGTGEEAAYPLAFVHVPSLVLISDTLAG